MSASTATAAAGGSGPPYHRPTSYALTFLHSLQIIDVITEIIILLQYTTIYKLHICLGKSVRSYHSKKLN